MAQDAGADSHFGVQDVTIRRRAFGRPRNGAICEQPSVVGKRLCVALASDDGGRIGGRRPTDRRWDEMLPDLLRHNHGDAEE